MGRYAQPGNVLRLQHGAFSPRTVEPVARAIAERLVKAAPYLSEPRYAGAVEALAVTEARLRLLDNWIGQHGLLNRKGRPWAAADFAYRLERLADNLRQSLGLTPASRARLGRNVAAAEVDYARLWSGQQRDAGGAVPTVTPDAADAGDTVPEPEAGPPPGFAGGDT